jgi:hypothetical protein
MFLLMAGAVVKAKNAIINTRVVMLTDIINIVDTGIMRLRQHPGRLVS